MFQVKFQSESFRFYALNGATDAQGKLMSRTLSFNEEPDKSLPQFLSFAEAKKMNHFPCIVKSVFSTFVCVTPMEKLTNSDKEKLQDFFNRKCKNNLVFFTSYGQTYYKGIWNAELTKSDNLWIKDLAIAEDESQQFVSNYANNSGLDFKSAQRDLAKATREGIISGANSFIQKQLLAKDMETKALTFSKTPTAVEQPKAEDAIIMVTLHKDGKEVTVKESSKQWYLARGYEEIKNDPF